VAAAASALRGAATRCGSSGIAARPDAALVSLVVTFRFLEEANGLPPADPWFAKLRDAYLEPWGNGLAAALELAERLGRFAHAFGWVSLRRLLPPDSRAAYDVPFAVVLRRALATI